MFSAKSAIFVAVVLFACLTSGQVPEEDQELITLVRLLEDDTGEEELAEVLLSVEDEVTVDFMIVNEELGDYLVRSSDERVFEVEVLGNDDNTVPVNETFQVKISGKFLGIESLQFVDVEGDLIAATYTIKVKRVPKAISVIFTYTLLVWLIISYVSMGALMDWPTLKERLYPPWPIIIGMICQFILMPLVTFILANVSINFLENLPPPPTFISPNS